MTEVNVEVRMYKRQFFCDIHFTVVEDESSSPIEDAWVNLYSGMELITKTMTDADGKADILTMPSGERYDYKVTHEDYEDAVGAVTTI